MTVSSRQWLLLALILTACGSARNSLAQCPNWGAGQRRAEIIAACGAGDRGDPKSRCQRALKRCRGGCDICQFLGSSNGLDAYVADKDEWGPIKRVPTSKDEPNGYKGTRAMQDGGWFRRQYKFNWYLCNQEDFIDVLGATIAHEAMHECISVNPPGILDNRFAPPPGCSAEDLENICVGK